MSDIAIRVEGLGKRYRIGQRQRYKALRDTLTEAMYAPLRAIGALFRGRSQEDGPEADNFIWALKDVSFEVKYGEVIGVIGRNGAGKSTLLKILSRITEPTEGSAEIHGRVGSLLEVGTGFHPELTGRENVYLSGTILGMKKAEIDRKFDEIVAFAEIENFLDTQVKHYSSGMYVRLAFAVAAHLEPEILLVDEVLAVGDLSFQRKCLGKMSDIAKGGRTVVFVSHNMAAVRKLCSHAVLLDKGKICSCGEPAKVIMNYLEGAGPTQSLYRLSPPTETNAPGWAHTLIVENGNGCPTVTVPVGQPWQVRVNFTIWRRTEHFIIALGLRTSEELILRTSWSNPYILEPGEYTAIFREDKILLGSGRYYLIIGLSTYERTFHYIENAGFLDIAGFAEGTELVRVSDVGAILNPLSIEIRKVEDKNR